MEDFANAALRHWKDAQLLESKNRVDNADHHFGVAAECALKSVLTKLPAFSSAGVLNGMYKLHINALWGNAMLQSLPATHRDLLSILQGDNAYAHWRIEQRYFAEGTVTLAAMAAHKKMTSRLLVAAHLSIERRP